MVRSRRTELFRHLAHADGRLGQLARQRFALRPVSVVPAAGARAARSFVLLDDSPSWALALAAATVLQWPLLVVDA